MTNVPQPTFGAAGFAAPLEIDILTGITADINAAFGGTLNPAPNTPQGQLAATMTACIGNVNDDFVYMTNQFNPVYAQGRWQDGLAYIYFINRNGAQPTVVQATCSGLTGTVIGIGALALAADGNVYTCTVPGTIDITGTCQATFSCTLPGPVACPSGSLNTIYQAIPGWDSVTNIDDGTIGNATETQAQFEQRRYASVANNSLGALPSVLGAVLGVTGVLDAYVTENYTTSPLTVGGYTLVANSLYVAAVGGAAADIANAIWTRKAPGCNTNGNTLVTVYDTNYEAPQPSYLIKFEVPAPLSILFAVDIANNAFVPANAVALIQAAIIYAFAGEDGGPRARIGATIYASRFYAGVAALGAWAQIIAIQVGCANNSAADCPTGSIAGTTFTEGGSVTGSFAIGQTLTDLTGNILPGTTITGGTSPTWTVSLTQTVAAEAVYGVLATLNDVTAQIDQTPSLSAANIVVTLT